MSQSAPETDHLAEILRVAQEWLRVNLPQEWAVARVPVSNE